MLSYKSIYAEPELLELHLKTADKSIELLTKNDFINQIRSTMASLLEGNRITLEKVAASNNMTSRQLRYQLGLVGKTFKEILDDLKHELATRLLIKTNESINEIIYLTGFSEPSTFYRAFDRWEKMTPIAYRNKNKSNLV